MSNQKRRMMDMLNANTAPMAEVISGGNAYAVAVKHNTSLFSDIISIGISRFTAF